MKLSMKKRLKYSKDNREQMIQWVLEENLEMTLQRVAL